MVFLITGLDSGLVQWMDYGMEYRIFKTFLSHRNISFCLVVYSVTHHIQLWLLLTCIQATDLKS